MNKLTLASSSQPRRDILESLGIDYEVIPSCFDESSVREAHPGKLVESLASAKAKIVAVQFPDKYVLGCDSIFWFDGLFLGKQPDSRSALNTLLLMRGREAKCYTGYSLCFQGTNYSIYSYTRVGFRDFSEKEAQAYIQTKEHVSAAGGIKISKMGSVMISYIHGSFYNVVGLCPSILSILLGKHGVSIFDFALHSQGATAGADCVLTA